MRENFRIDEEFFQETFVIAAETDHLAGKAARQLSADEVDDASAVRPTVEVVAHQDERVFRVDRGQFRERAFERCEVAVDITHREGAVRHAPRG